MLEKAPDFRWILPHVPGRFVISDNVYPKRTDARKWISNLCPSRPELNSLGLAIGCVLTELRVEVFTLPASHGKPCTSFRRSWMRLDHLRVDTGCVATSIAALTHDIHPLARSAYGLSSNTTAWAQVLTLVLYSRHRKEATVLERILV